MADSLKHRGPDGKGYFLDQFVSLGHRRLSIIDLKGGKQPLFNEDKTIVIVFNGEIYNFQELRLRLEKNGHRFKTNSDTEVIVHAYEEYGPNCLKYFNGMFAFCLYDLKKKLLFLARDRFGVKPLYYHINANKQLVFGSEIKALLKNNTVKTAPNSPVIRQYLSQNKIPEDQTDTFFDNIYKVLPGHYLVWQNERLSVREYYSISILSKTIKESTESESVLIHKYQALFKDSVRLRLISDVAVGSCLSGGLDSSSIVANVDNILKKTGNIGSSVKGSLHCFSAVYNDKTIDESYFIKEVVKGKRLLAHYTFPNAKGFKKDLGNLVYHQDEPTETIAVYAQYCVMRLAKHKVKVLLDGQGSDETLAGYIPYYRHFLLDLIKSGQIVQLGIEIAFGYRHLKRMLTSYLKLTKGQWHSRSFFPDNTSRVNYLKKSQMSLKERLWSDIEHTLPNVLRYEDRNSMAFGIEARLPFLDYRLVEFAMSLPSRMKLRRGWTKYILRKSFSDILPPKITWRKNKLGFSVPDYQWLVSNRYYILKVLSSSTAKSQNYFDQMEAIRLFNLMCQDKKNGFYTNYFWRILNLTLWLQVFFNQ